MICERKGQMIIAKAHLSTSFVRTTGNTLSDHLPISVTISLCNGFGKEEIFLGRPRTACIPFSHTVTVRKRERRVPERQLEMCLTRKPAKTFK
jgi:hypothetical protein